VFSFRGGLGCRKNLDRPEPRVCQVVSLAATTDSTTACPR
jgi:hypothetical protein